MKTKDYQDKIDRFCEYYLKNGTYKSKKRLLFRCKQVFKGIDIMGKDMLEIGAGRGVFSSFAAVNGANKVMAMEPEAEGSSSNSSELLRNICDKCSIGNLVFSNQTIQEFDPKKEKFDIILLYNSINHLDEKHCITLNRPESEKCYMEIFKKINSLLKDNGILVIADVSPSNFWPLVGLKNPLMPSIEWEKHQTPTVWCKLAEKSGFHYKNISWYSLYHMRLLGLLTANRLVQYFLTSHVRLILTRN